MAVGNRNDHYLHRGEPDREGAREVFDNQGHEAFRRARHGTMDHYRQVHLPILANILKVEVLRLNEVELNG